MKGFPGTGIRIQTERKKEYVNGPKKTHTKKILFFFKKGLTFPCPYDIINTVEARPVGQEAKTRPSHGCNMGSIPVRVTKQDKSELLRKSKLVRICFFTIIIQVNT